MSKQQDFSMALYNQLVSWKDFSDQQAAVLTAMGLAQAQGESTDFTSHLCQAYNNCIGYTATSSSKWQTGRASDQPEEPGINAYGVYPSIAACARELGDYIHRRASAMREVNNISDYAQVLKNSNYYTAPLSQYISMMGAYYESPQGEYSTEQPTILQKALASVKMESALYIILAVSIGALVYFGTYVTRRLFRFPVH